jgi:hypothetical protein
LEKGNDTYLDFECGAHDDAFTSRYTEGGQKEKENKNQNKKEKQQQEAFNPKIDKYPDTDNNQKVVDVKEIIEFWDDYGFGFSNMNAKEQLLVWLDDSSFLQPKDMILKAIRQVKSDVFREVLRLQPSNFLLLQIKTIKYLYYYIKYILFIPYNSINE